MISLGLDPVEVEAVRWVLPVRARRHQAALLLNFGPACCIVRRMYWSGCIDLEQFVLTYRAGSPKSSLIENFLSGCVSEVAQSMLIFWSMDSSTSVILGLNSGT